VADLIDASTEAAARSAARSLDGAFSREIGLLAEKIVELRLLVEATLDFPEEEIEFLERAGARRRLAEAKAQIAAVLATARQGALLNEGMRVVLAGQPNVGKSSLLNALAGAELAIVTDIPGTTRDKVGETIQIEGVPVHVTDTAGLREAGDAVEAIGVARSWSAIGEADAVVWLRDLTRIGEVGLRRRRGDASTSGWRPRSPRPRSSRSSTRPTPLRRGRSRRRRGRARRLGRHRRRPRPAARGAPRRAGWQAAGEGVFHARARHVDALQRAGMHLDAAEAHAEAGDQALELVAEELRAAHDALGEITGTFTADDLLGRSSVVFVSASKSHSPLVRGGAGQGAAICDRVALLARAHHR
jgi:tRNA modification GTPase